MAKLITIDEAVANAKTIIPEANGIEEIFMRQWMYLGIRQIGVTLTHIKTVEITPENLSVRKPEDYVRGEDIGLYNGTTEYAALYEGFGQRVHKDKRGINVARPVQLSEDNNFFYLSSNATAIDKVVLRYYALPVDSDTNDLMIDEESLVALMMFIKYMVALRNNLPTVNLLNKEWRYQAARVRAKNALPDQLQFKTGLVKKYMSRMITPDREWF